MAPYLQTAMKTADDYVDYSLSLFPDVLAQEKYAPARYAHIREVIKSFYLLKTRDFETLYNMLPSQMQKHEQKNEYFRSLGLLVELFNMLNKAEQNNLETAIILHDIGYPGGKEFQHPKRGQILAQKILPPETQHNIPLLILGHGIFPDIGTYYLPSDFTNLDGTILTDSDRIQLLLLSVVDAMGKVKNSPDNNGFINNNIMTTQNIRRLADVMAGIATDEKVKNWANKLLHGKPHKPNTSWFWEQRLQNTFCPIFFGIHREIEEIRTAVDSFVGAPHSPERESFEKLWSTNIRVSVFALFLNFNRQNNFEAVVKLASSIAKVAGPNISSNGKINFDTDIDYMNMPIQNAHALHLEILASILARPDWQEEMSQLLEYNKTTNTIVFKFKTLDTAANALQAKRIAQAA